MDILCKVCNSPNIVNITYDLPLPEQSKKNSFIPTGSDFGIFYPLFKCRKCSTLFSIPTFKEEELKQLYSESKDYCYVEQNMERTLTHKRIVQYLTKLHPPPARLLDIGCSYGFFLSIAQQYGYHAQGIELNTDAYQHCRNMLKLDVSHRDIQDMHDIKEQFDIVTAFEVVEHLLNPRNFIEIVLKLLKPGGIFCCATPNVQSLSAKVFGQRWWSFRKMHFCYFSKQSIYYLLEKNGFSIIRSFPYKKTFTINYIVDRMRYMLHDKIFHFFNKSVSLLKIDKLPISASFGDIIVFAKKI